MAPSPGPAQLWLTSHPAPAPTRVAESAHLYDQLPWAFHRFSDGDQVLMPMGFGAGFGGLAGRATGTVTDRKHGRDLGQFWNEIDLRNFRLISRHLAEKNAVGKGFMGLLTDFHIRGGFGWQACLLGARKGAYDTGTAGADPSVRRAQWVLDRWRDGERGRVVSRWPIRSREGFLRWRRDGEVFVRLFPGAAGKPPVLRFVDPAQVGSPMGTTDGPDSFGVLCDPHDAETVLAYFVRAAAGSGGAAGEWVSARRDPETVRQAEQLLGQRVKPGTILHLPANVDAGVKRGVPDFLPVVEQLTGVDDLVDNMITVAVAQAAIAWVEQYATATEEQVRTLISQGADYTRPKLPHGGWPGQARTSDVTRSEAGTVKHVDGGRNLLPGPTSSPAGLIQVEQAALRWVGVLWRFPEYFSGDASNGSYASLKESGSPFVAAVEGSQQVWGAFEAGAAVAVLELAAESRVETPDGPFTRADLERVDVETTAPKVVLTDRQQEAATADMKLRNGTLSKAEAIQMDGRDPKHTFANIAAEAKQDQQTPGIQPGADDGFGTGDAGAGGDDPFGGGPASEAVVTEGFTGTVTDSRGREFHYQDGKRVAAPGAAAGAGARPRATAPGGVGTFHHERVGAAVAGRVRQLKGIANRFGRGEIDAAEADRLAAVWGRQTRREVAAHYDDALAAAEEQFAADFGDAAVESPEWQEVRAAVKAARAGVTGVVGAAADQMQGGDKKFNLGHHNARVRQVLADLPAATAAGQQAVWDAIKTARDAAGGKKETHPLKRYWEDKPLTKKVITNKAGHKQTVYVAADEPAAAGGGGGDPTTIAPSGRAARALAAVKHIGSKAMQTKLGRAALWLEHKAAFFAHKTREVAAEAGRRRKPPMTEDGVARLNRVLALADFIGGSAAGVGVGMINPIAGKVTSMSLPTASVLYLAYSAATNPRGTWAAAKQVVRDTLSGKSHHHEGTMPELADRLAALLGGPDADWREAVFLAALAETGDASKAADVAEAAGPMPDELPEATADDFGGEGDE